MHNIPFLGLYFNFYWRSTLLTLRSFRSLTTWQINTPFIRLNFDIIPPTAKSSGFIQSFQFALLHGCDALQGCRRVGVGSLTGKKSALPYSLSKSNIVGPGDHKVRCDDM